MLVDLPSLIKAVGYFGVFAMVLAESGLLVGFFLPGDTLLFAAGFLASQGYLDIRILIPLLFIAAFSGDNIGYFIGSKVGTKIFSREESWFLKKSYLETTKDFFERHGSKAIILARFVPVVRAFMPLLAGVGKMRYRKFVIFDALGAVFWAVGITLLGYFLGNTVPNIDKYILPILAVIILLSISPTIVHLAKNKGFRSGMKEKAKNLFKEK